MVLLAIIQWMRINGKAMQLLCYKGRSILYSLGRYVVCTCDSSCLKQCINDTWHIQRGENCQSSFILQIKNLPLYGKCTQHMLTQEALESIKSISTHIFANHCDLMPCSLQWPKIQVKRYIKFCEVFQQNKIFVLKPTSML